MLGQIYRGQYFFSLAHPLVYFWEAIQSWRKCAHAIGLTAFILVNYSHHFGILYCVSDIHIDKAEKIIIPNESNERS